MGFSSEISLLLSSLADEATAGTLSSKQAFIEWRLDKLQYTNFVSVQL